MKKTNKIEFRYYETDEAVIALTGKRWEIPYGTDSMHFHNYLEIGLCRYGEGTMYLGKNEIPYCDGTITIIPKDFVHRTGGKDNEIQKWEYLFVDSEKFINKIYSNNLHYASVLLKRLHSRMLVLNSEEYPRLTTIFNLILEKMVEKSEFYQEEVQGLLYAALLEIIELNSKEALQKLQGKEHTNFENIIEVLHYIEQNYIRELRVTELAKKANMSETHFRRVFEEYMNVSPAEYVNFIRIEKACELMRKQDIKIQEVGFKVGFPVETTFLRNFKRITGDTPQTWKKRLKTDANYVSDYKISVLKGW